MSIEDKIKNAKSSNWLFENVSQEEIDYERKSAKIVTFLYEKRSELKMNQKEFAKHMGVTQALISRWENGDVNFSLDKLTEILNKLNCTFEIKIVANENKYHEESFSCSLDIKKEVNKIGQVFAKGELVYGY
ncbi:MAG: helix-turn-helix transcriptional regulator [bacterium]